MIGDNVFVVSDPHFYHLNMIKNRGFDSIEQYHEFYIKTWNNIISKRDIVYILGDITMEKNKYEILDSLKGIKHIILGNHDCHKRSHLESLMRYVNKIMVSEKLYLKNDFQAIMTHIPIHPIEFDYRISINIHGHLHNQIIPDNRYINICPENKGYEPMRIINLLK